MLSSHLRLLPDATICIIFSIYVVFSSSLEVYTHLISCVSVMLPLSILWHPLGFIIIIIIIYWFLTCSFLVLSIMRCSILISTIIYATFPSLSFRKCTKNDPRRTCPFCGSFQLRLTRHLRLRHGNEKEVSDALGLPMSRRNEAFATIRKNGMYKHNVKMMKSTECELLRERESRANPRISWCVGHAVGVTIGRTCGTTRAIATLPKTLFPRPTSQYR